MSLLDASKTRPLEGGASYSLGHRAFRAGWWLSWMLLAAWTPPPFHFWRRWVLVMFGATLHRTVRVYGSARIWYPPNLVMAAHSVLGPKVECYCMAKVTIGEKAVVSQQAYLCGGTHDIRSPHFQLITRDIEIKANAWVAARAFIGPGVTVAEGSIVGAGSVVFRNTEPDGVYIGNPAALIKRRGRNLR